MSKICTRCKAQLPDNAMFCNRCGQRFAPNQGQMGNNKGFNPGGNVSPPYQTPPTPARPVKTASSPVLPVLIVIIVIGVIAVIGLGMIALFGSVSPSNSNNTNNIVQTEENENTDENNQSTSNNGHENQNENQDENNENSSENNELLNAKRRSYYGYIAYCAGSVGALPDGTMLAMPEDAANLQNNQFAICDIDQDGIEECILEFTSTSIASMKAMIYEYDPVTNTLHTEFEEFPSITYYKNNCIGAKWSHHIGMNGDMWPYTLYQYNASSDTYEFVSKVDSWKSSYMQTDSTGKAFPYDVDKDGDGVIYILSERNNSSPKYIDNNEFEAWFNSYTSESYAYELPLENTTYDNYGPYTEKYINMLTDYINKSLPNSDYDAGVAFMKAKGDVDDIVEDTTKKYGLSFVLENTVAYVSRKDGVTFCASMEDAGSITYENGSIEGLTVLGIYPGMSVSEASNLLESFGLICEEKNSSAMKYCTGASLGDYGIHMKISNNQVTSIYLSANTKYAG